MIIFDSFLHGYNGLIESEEQINKFIPQFNWTKIPKEIIVVVRNSLTYEEFTEEFDESFENIEIYTLLNGKKQKFFEEETA